MTDEHSLASVTIKSLKQVVKLPPLSHPVPSFSPVLLLIIMPTLSRMLAVVVTLPLLDLAAMLLVILPLMLATMVTTVLVPLRAVPVVGLRLPAAAAELLPPLVSGVVAVITLVDDAGVVVELLNAHHHAGGPGIRRTVKQLMIEHQLTGDRSNVNNRLLSSI